MNQGNLEIINIMALKYDMSIFLLRVLRIQQGPHGGTQEEDMNDTGKTWIELPLAVV